ncbi:MAG: hypothetical protein MPJ02_00055 [Nitrosopumilus sp.]|nr:hypothetical protein [Nitrosopumilus sp.]MDA7998785.1 hypothetical protein [Nitrosopumilus sp.]
MRDKVVYGFIAVFIAGTILSMAMAEDQGTILSTVITENSDSSHGWTASYAMTGMALALCYHAAYIFHLVYKLQLSQMLSDNDKKIKKYSRNRDRSRLYTRFEIWEGIMEKAVETGNRVIFERGIKGAFGTMRDNACITEPEIFDRLAECAENVSKLCMDGSRYRFVDTYVIELLKTHSALSSVQEANLEWITAVRSGIIEEVEDIMHRAIDDDEYGACADYIDWVMKSLWDDIRIQGDWDQIDIIHDCVENVVKYGILKNGAIAEIFVGMTLEELEKDHKDSMKIIVSGFPTDEYALEWYRQMFRILKRITLKMTGDGEQFAFMDCMTAMMGLCNKYEELISELDVSESDESYELELIRMFSYHISEVINASVTRNQHTIIVAFKNILKHDLTEMTRSNYQGESGRIWRRALWVTFGAVMSRAAYTDDQATLSTVAVRTDILNHVLDNCDRDEVESIIETDIKYMRNAFDSATGKSHTGTTEMLADLHRKMEEMLRGRWEKDLADRYAEALEELQGARKSRRDMESAASKESDSSFDEQGGETQVN